MPLMVLSIVDIIHFVQLSYFAVNTPLGSLYINNTIDYNFGYISGESFPELQYTLLVTP